MFGVFFVLLGGIGFFGSLVRKPKFLYIYGSLSTALVILEIFVVLMVYVFRSEMEYVIKREMVKMFNMYNGEDEVLNIFVN